MTQSKNRLTAMTAIAAVLALATPAMAQDAQPAPVSTAPDPLSATTVADPASSTAPAPSTATPVDPLSAESAVEAAPAPAAQARTTPRRATTAPPTRTRSATSVRSTAPAIGTTSPPSANPAPADAPAPIVAATPPAVAIPAPVEAAPAPPVASANNDILPIAAAGGLGLLALLGAGVALRRRKRRHEEGDYAAFDEPQVEQSTIPVAFDEPVREPMMKRTPVTPRAPIMGAPVAAAVTSKPTDASAASLPDGFDLSRFGAHVQAAYRGPTDDNPSLSLKSRLRRGSAMDQMARNDGDAAQPAAAPPTAASAPPRDTGAVVSKMRAAPRASGSFMVGDDTPRPNVRPVTQH